MKKLSIPFLIIAALWAVPMAAPAQSAVVQERLDRLSAQIQDLIDAKDAQNKRIEELARQIRQLQDQQNQPTPTYATQDDLKQLAAKLKEIDQKRQHDNELILKKIKSLAKTLTLTSPAVNVSSQGGSSSAPSKGYEYVIQANDTISAIARAYSQQGIKVTTKQILKANPGLNPKKLQPGQKIFIPQP